MKHFRWAVAVAALGGFLFGYDTGVISGALLFVNRDFDLTSFQEGCVVSGLLLGAALGAVVAGRAADRFGRRRSIIAVALLFLVGIAWVSAAPGTLTLIAGRFVLGLAVGAGSMTVPMYLSEIAPPEHRGRIVATNQLMITSGILVAYLVDYALAGTEEWRAMFAIGAIPAIALFFGMLRMPESPRWLAANDQEDAARAILAPGTDPDELDATLADWHEERTQQERSRGWAELLVPGLRPALIVGVGLAAIQQFGGINTVIYYAPTIMEDTGLNVSDAILYSIAIGVINVLVTLVAMRLVDRWGRRRLLAISLTGMTASLGLLGLAFALGSGGGASSGLALVCLLAYICAFAIGLGPVFWVMIAEIYPLRARGQAMAAATAVNWLSNFTVGLLFPVVVDAVGQDVTFWGFAVICGASLVFVARLVPETKDRTLEQIEEDFARRRAAASSSRSSGGSAPTPPVAPAT